MKLKQQLAEYRKQATKEKGQPVYTFIHGTPTSVFNAPPEPNKTLLIEIWRCKETNLLVEAFMKKSEAQIPELLKELICPALKVIHEGSNIVDTSSQNEEPTAKEELKIHVCPVCLNVSLNHKS